MLETTAAAGYVVIALESCATSSNVFAEKDDLLRSIAYVNATAALAGRVDWAAKVGVYSQGII